MNARSPERPLPHPMSTSTGAVGVRINARTATMAVRRMENISEEGMNRSITVFTGRMAREKALPSEVARPSACGGARGGWWGSGHGSSIRGAV